MNRRTVAAALRGHSKASIGDTERAALGATVVTHDNLLRLRPHAGLVLTSPSAEVDGATIAALCGEVCVTDRGFRAGTRLTGRPPIAVLLVENLGVYVDVPLPDGWCAAHVPGWNVSMVTVLREARPETPALIFGDLDPNGVAIAPSLRASWPGMTWFIPSFAGEYLGRAQVGEWPEVGGDGGSGRDRQDAGGEPALVGAGDIRAGWEVEGGIGGGDCARSFPSGAAGLTARVEANTSSGSPPHRPRGHFFP